MDSSHILCIEFVLEQYVQHPKKLLTHDPKNGAPFAFLDARLADVIAHASFSLLILLFLPHFYALPNGMVYSASHE